MNTVTLAFLLTPGGILTAGFIAAGFIEYIKSIFPALDKRFSGALMSGVVLLVLYLLAGIATMAFASLDGIFSLFQWWLAAASAAVGGRSVVTHAGLNPFEKP